MIKIIEKADQQVATWMAEELGCAPFMPPYVAYGIIGPNETYGGVLLNDYYPNGNIEITVAGNVLASRRLIRMMYSHIFESLGCSRITAKTKRSNKKAIQALERLGFTFEVVQKRYFGPTKQDDAIVYAGYPSNFEKFLNRKVH